MDALSPFVKMQEMHPSTLGPKGLNTTDFLHHRSEWKTCGMGKLDDNIFEHLNFPPFIGEDPASFYHCNNTAVSSIRNADSSAFSINSFANEDIPGTKPGNHVTKRPPMIGFTCMPVSLEAGVDNIESTKFRSADVTVSLQEDVNPEAGGVDSIKSTKLECTEDPIHYKANEISVQFLVTGNTTNILDGYNWLKYGQKNRKNSINPRSYFRCAHPDCHVKKQTELSSDCEGKVSITYYGKHDHLPPNIHVSSNAKRPKH